MQLSSIILLSVLAVLSSAAPSSTAPSLTSPTAQPLSQTTQYPLSATPTATTSSCSLKVMTLADGSWGYIQPSPGFNAGAFVKGTPCSYTDAAGFQLPLGNGTNGTVNAATSRVTAMSSDMASATANAARSGLVAGSGAVAALFALALA